jgi:hypothetical protein
MSSGEDDDEFSQSGGDEESGSQSGGGEDEMEKGEEGDVEGREEDLEAPRELPDAPKAPQERGVYQHGIRIRPKKQKHDKFNLYLWIICGFKEAPLSGEILTSLLEETTKQRNSD